MKRHQIVHRQQGKNLLHEQFETQEGLQNATREVRKNSLEFEAEDCWAKLRNGVEVEWKTFGDGEEVRFKRQVTNREFTGFELTVEAQYNASTGLMELLAVCVEHNVVTFTDITDTLSDMFVQDLETEAAKQIVAQWLQTKLSN